jgi:hypothetical protein
LIREMMKKKAKEQEEEDNSSSSTERYAVLAAYATFLRKEKGKTAHATRKRVTYRCARVPFSGVFRTAVRAKGKA